VETSGPGVYIMFIAYCCAAKMRPSYGNWDVFLDEINDLVDIIFWQCLILWLSFISLINLFTSKT